MATALSDSAVVAGENEDMDNTPDHAVPETKSGVRVDPNAALQSAKYGKGDIVHTSQDNGTRLIKLTGEVYRLQYNPTGRFIEYKLKDVLTGNAITGNGGAWFRERDLRLQKRAS